MSIPERGYLLSPVLPVQGIGIMYAPRGIGKTFAYLVPALLSGLKTIVSTGTRALQDQLYHRDLPRVRAALDVDGARGGQITVRLVDADEGRAHVVEDLHRQRGEAAARRVRRALHEQDDAVGAEEPRI